MTRPALVVTVDTEEEGLWSGSYRATGNTCRNIARLPRLHAIFARLGVRPTYLVDHPVASDAAACGVLRDLAAGGAAEIGAHLHPWCTPPLSPRGTRPRATYPHQLPQTAQEAKLATLLHTIERGLGARPRSYRAGRWGFDASTVPVLERLGLTVDTSVTPLWWDPSPGGPSFVAAPKGPYRIDRAHACRAGVSGIVEVPVSAGFVGRRARAFERLARLIAPAPAPGLRRMMVALGLRTLQPEVFARAEMCALADELAGDGARVFNVAFHSSSALPGGTPYVRDERALDAFAARLEGLLEHLLERHGATPLGVSEVPGYLGGELGAGRSAAA